MKKPAKTRFPQAPRTLGPAGRKLWRRVVEAYRLDDGALLYLEAACQSQDRESGATEKIAEQGTTTKDRFDQLKVNPEVLIERDSRAAKLRSLKMIGLDLEPLNDGPGRPPRNASPLRFGSR